MNEEVNVFLEFINISSYFNILFEFTSLTALLKTPLWLRH